MSTFAPFEFITALKPYYAVYDAVGRVYDLMRAVRYGRTNPLWSKRHIFQLAMQANMQDGIRGGSGNKAEKRRILLVEHKMQLIRESLEAMIARSKARERQFFADAAAERRSEGRLLRKTG